MEIIYQKQALEDLDFWKLSGNKQIQKKITELLNDIVQHPFTGIGKPEPLKHELQGCWSRRITNEHRLIYEIFDENIHILSMRGHY
ncbi:MAG: Txe/YoeB family addiction module toxin [Bacteroidales bacterium]|jgi:toxin YoeB|nr:Txe/YoeB family addiction module toxin [Bacteroidales bacterium]